MTAPTSTSEAPAVPDLSFDFEFARKFVDKIKADLPKEKLTEQLRQISLWRAMRMAGSVSVNGLGQRAGVISSRTFMRQWLENPGCWNDPGFVKNFFKDNPQCRAPGYNPQGTRLGRGVTTLAK